MDITAQNTLDVSELDITEARELLACRASVRLGARSALVVIRPPAVAVRVVVGCAAVRLHAARSSIADGARRCTACALHQSPIGIAVSGFGAFKAAFRVFESEARR